MHNLEDISNRIHLSFDARTSARESALAHARQITRNCANAIRAIHRDELEEAQNNLADAQRLVNSMQSNLIEYPDLYYTGYAQDSLKEYAEAHIFLALSKNLHLPSPEDLGIEFAPYLQGLAEAVGELRRRCLDIIRHGHSTEAERLLSNMEDIYAILITMDYPDAVTGGLRRLTDIVRSITERTRGDLTISLRQELLEESLRRLEAQLNG